MWKGLQMMQDQYDQDMVKSDPETLENLRANIISVQDEITNLLGDYGISDDRIADLVHVEKQADIYRNVYMWMCHKDDEDE